MNTNKSSIFINSIHDKYFYIALALFIYNETVVCIYKNTMSNLKENEFLKYLFQPDLNTKNVFP